jgi:hypothetical protein
MRYCKCTVSVHATLYILVCDRDIYWCVPRYLYIGVYHKVCVCVIVEFLLLSFKLNLGCLFSTHHVNQGGVQRLPGKSLFTSHTLLKGLSGDAELADTVRY